MASDPSVIKTDEPSGIPPASERRLEKAPSKCAARVSSKLRMNPPIPWAAAYRLPDGVVTADEGEAEESANFILKVKDQPKYCRLAIEFRGAPRFVTRFVTDAQLRRWKASDWWPKDRR